MCLGDPIALCPHLVESTRAITTSSSSWPAALGRATVPLLAPCTHDAQAWWCGAGRGGPAGWREGETLCSHCPLSPSHPLPLSRCVSASKLKNARAKWIKGSTAGISSLTYFRSLKKRGEVRTWCPEGWQWCLVGQQHTALGQREASPTSFQGSVSGCSQDTCIQSWSKEEGKAFQK